jgi:hypothetical protein
VLGCHTSLEEIFMPHSHPPPYSIVLWLNVPGPQAGQEEEVSSLRERELKPGAQTHVFNAPAATRLVYGSYETHEEALSAFDEIASCVARDQVLRVEGHNERETLYLVPAKSLYYAVLAPTA